MSAAAPALAAEAAPAPPLGSRRVLLFGYLVLALCLVGFGGWAALAPLASAVVAAGMVKVDSSRKAVQHLEGGIVERILVRDGDKVEVGDVLVRLDGTRAAATLAIAEGGYYAALAHHDRLRAERDGLAEVAFGAELTARGDDPKVAEVMDAQRQLFKARQVSLEGQLEIQAQQIEFLRDEIVGLEAQQRAKQRQIGIAGGELKDLRTLLDRGLTDKARVLALERELAELEGELGEHVARIAARRSQIAEKELEQIQLRKSFHEEVVSELRTVQTDLFDLAERATAARHTVEHIDIRAPVSGVVVDTRIHTEGGIIGPGDTLLQIVPEGEQLVVEARVLPRDIDSMQVGLPARVKFTAFKQRQSPELEGVVTYVSADALVEPSTNESYFLARIEVSEEELARLQDAVLVPGMQADVFVRTGERTAVEYLLQPLTDSFDRAWREE